jgi:hypothetical protein
MTRTLLTAIFLTLLSQTAWAHKCVLGAEQGGEMFTITASAHVGSVGTL